MSSKTIPSDVPLVEHRLSSWLTFLLAGACGLIAANVYYAQPLIGMISSDLGLSPQAAGLIITLTQLGYAAGLVLIVPLADLIENRRLAVGMIGVGVIALTGAAMATHAQTFLIASLFIGFGSVSVQILVPYAAHLAPEAVRGRTVGNVMSGLMLGIMLARPVASLMADVLAARRVGIRRAVPWQLTRKRKPYASTSASRKIGLQAFTSLDGDTSPNHTRLATTSHLPVLPVRCIHAVLDSNPFVADRGGFSLIANRCRSFCTCRGGWCCRGTNRR